MKKSLLSVGAACFAAMFTFSGCITSEGDAYIAELEEFISGSKALERIEPTKHIVVDPLIAGSTLLYINVGGEMRDTVESRFGAMYVISSQKALTSYTAEWEGIEEGDQKSYDKLFAIFEKEIFPELKGCPKGVTAKLVFEEICDKKASYTYTTDYLDLVKEDKAKAQEQFKKRMSWIERGKKATKKVASSIDWERRKARREQLAADLKKLQKSMVEATQELKKEMQVLQGQLTELSQKPAMKSYLSEIAPLMAQKAFASAEACKEIDKQIDAIAMKAEYKTVVAMQKNIAAKLELTGDALVVLGDKVGGQLAYTAKAIPWMIESDSALQTTEDDQKQ